MTDSATVVEFEPALVAVTIEALTAELRLTRNMLADANETLSSKLHEATNILASAEKDIADFEETLAAQVKYGDPVRGSLVPSSTLGGGFMTSQEHSARTVTITWDGSDEAFGAIREALGHGRGVLEVWLSGDEYGPSIEITDRRTLNRVGLVVHGARIRIECDSFAILPPEVTP